MKRITTQVVIIGGGATGAGIMRDCALRGIDCILLERDDIAAGTTGRRFSPKVGFSTTRPKYRAFPAS